MRVVLAAVNASYIHTPLALYALRAYCEPFSKDIIIASFTINHTDEKIIRQIYEYKPDVLGFSCAIWNIAPVVRIASALKQLLPSVVILFGGPEVAEEYEAYLLNGPADIVVPGEGERPLFEILTRFNDGALKQEGQPLTARRFSGLLQEVYGIAFLEYGRVTVNPVGPPLEANEIPFPYKDGLHAFEHKLIYYESSRGCPYRCGYCLSSVTGGVRFKPLPDIFRDLRVFLNAGVKRVKFTDRTFNADKIRALRIWRFLMENDNGITNFHFEIKAEQLDDEAIQLLRQARPGLFQFEIGVQSVNPRVLSAVGRRSDIGGLFDKVSKIRSAGNIHLHLDLIAGLPGEDYASFIQSFNEVYGTRPDQLQLGFLKLLKGTSLRKDAEATGIVYNKYPPYEILYNRDISYASLTYLKAVAEMTELFYNAGKFRLTLCYLRRWFSSPFALYEGLAGYWRRNRLFDEPHGKMRLYAILRDFSALHVPQAEALAVRDLLRFDLLANENEKGLPDWLTVTPPRDDIGRIRRCLKNECLKNKNNPSASPKGSNTERSAPAMRIERFEYDVLKWMREDTRELWPRTHYLLFCYLEPGRQPISTLPQRVREVLLDGDVR